jgi:surface protein
MFAVCKSLTSVPLFDTSNVGFMYEMFDECESLTSVPLLNTSKVANMEGMFEGCPSLTTIPLFDTSNVTNMQYMFAACINVESGALALYQQSSSQVDVPSHSGCFSECGINTTSGSAELAQIPDDWK